MSQHLGKMSIMSLRLQLPMFSTQTLFDAMVGLTKEQIKYESKFTKEIDKYQNELVRKKSIIEFELRERCVRKKITEKRRRGIVINNWDKIALYSHFTKWLKTYIERETRKSFYFKRK